MPGLVLPVREPPKAVVPSVLKAVRLLDTVAASPARLSLAALRDRLDLPKSSILSLCTSLTMAGLLRRHEDGCYHLGAHTVDLAHAYLARTDLTKEFERALLEITSLSTECAALATRDGADVVYVACRNGERPVGIAYRVGMRLPLSCTATGKALMSTLADTEIRRLFHGKKLPQLTAKSCLNVGTLLNELREVRQQGYAIDDEETHAGMYCIAVPICDPAERAALAAVGVSMIKSAGMASKRLQIVGALKELAQRLCRPLSLLR